MIDSNKKVHVVFQKLLHYFIVGSHGWIRSGYLSKIWAKKNDGRLVRLLVDELGNVADHACSLNLFIDNTCQKVATEQHENLIREPVNLVKITHIIWDESNEMFTEDY